MGGVGGGLREVSGGSGQGGDRLRHQRVPVAGRNEGVYVAGSHVAVHPADRDAGLVVGQEAGDPADTDAAGDQAVGGDPEMPGGRASFDGDVTIAGGPAPVRAYIDELLPDISTGRSSRGRSR